MSETDPSSFTSGDYNHDAINSLWNYGLEAWCNMEGQYVTFEADLSNLIGQSY